MKSKITVLSLIAATFTIASCGHPIDDNQKTATILSEPQESRHIYEWNLSNEKTKSMKPYQVREQNSRTFRTVLKIKRWLTQNGLNDKVVVKMHARQLDHYLFLSTFTIVSDSQTFEQIKKAFSIQCKDLGKYDPSKKVRRLNFMSFKESGYTDEILRQIEIMMRSEMKLTRINKNKDLYWNGPALPKTEEHESVTERLKGANIEYDESHNGREAFDVVILNVMFRLMHEQIVRKIRTAAGGIVYYTLIQNQILNLLSRSLKDPEKITNEELQAVIENVKKWINISAQDIIATKEAPMPKIRGSFSWPKGKTPPKTFDIVDRTVEVLTQAYSFEPHNFDSEFDTNRKIKEILGDVAEDWTFQSANQSRYFIQENDIGAIIKEFEACMQNRTLLKTKVPEMYLKFTRIY